jgi:hypothetical protein
MVFANRGLAAAAAAAAEIVMVQKSSVAILYFCVT